MLSHKLPKNCRVIFIKSIHHQCILHKISTLLAREYQKNIDYGDAVRPHVIYSKLLQVMYGKR